MLMLINDLVIGRLGDYHYKELGNIKQAVYYYSTESWLTRKC